MNNQGSTMDTMKKIGTMGATTPGGRTAAAGTLAGGVAYIVVTAMEMLEVPNLSPDKAAGLTWALGSIVAYIVQKAEK